jgi:hypothetical protein
VWYENGRRRQCESASEDGLAARVEKITARLAADAPGLERPGTELIAYYLSPVIAHLACEDIKTAHMQAAVNAAPTAGEGARLRRCISALVSAGITGGYLASLRVKDVHWQAGDRPTPELAATVAGESALFVDPAEIPAAEDVATLGQALAVLAGDYELMACFAAYTGLR